MAVFPYNYLGSTAGMEFKGLVQVDVHMKMYEARTATDEPSDRRLTQRPFQVA